MMNEILIVDDDRDYLGLVGNLLRQEGMNVCCVSSGEEGLARLKEGVFSLMITDYNMPGLNGIELARKAVEIVPQMPIIMSTGDMSPEISRLAEEVGIVAVLDKPFYPHDILELIKDASERSAAFQSYP
jgi:CheY-like chemotaxis protein